ncbi:MAG TPA: zinc metallopeptidase, partial [Tissierellaceae bacterium]
MLYYGPTWWIFVLPAVLFATYAQAKVTSAYNKYSQVSNDTGLTGHDVARMILDRNGLTDVKIQRGQGQLTDHYDPRSRIIRLSPAVYSGTTVASMSIAAHEVGHAIQHAQGYMPLKLRSAIVPLANIGSRLSFVFIMMGILFQNSFVNIGIIMFLMSVIFQVVTLPVEFNASSRALSELEQG